MKKRSITVLLIIICARMYAQGDAPVVEDTFQIRTAGSQYKASGWKMLWWGKHYRKEWATPVAFPVLQLSTFEGGLKPVKAGGGMNPNRSGCSPLTTHLCDSSKLQNLASMVVQGIQQEQFMMRA